MACIGREPEDKKVSYEDFYECETWSLDISIARFILPRLKFMIECTPTKKSEEWVQDLKLVVEGLELIANTKAIMLPPNSEEYKKVERALDLLREYFMGLWW